MWSLLWEAAERCLPDRGSRSSASVKMAMAKVLAMMVIQTITSAPYMSASP